MKEVPLSKGKVALVDDADFERVNAFKWHTLERDGKWHAMRTVKSQGVKTTVYMHRFIVGALPGEEVDHKSRNGLDNQRENLRRCTKRQNSLNRVSGAANKSSRYHGVTRNKTRDRWRVVICAGTRNERGASRQLYVGTFRDEDEAARAYDEAAVHHFGEFAVTNFAREQYV